MRASPEIQGERTKGSYIQIATIGIFHFYMICVLALFCSGSKFPEETVSDELNVTVKIPLDKIKQARRTLFEAIAVGERGQNLV